MNENRNKLGQRIAPGIWIDLDGNTHWSITELLAMVDLPDTPEHRELVTEMLKYLIRKECPTATIVYREKPE